MAGNIGSSGDLYFDEDDVLHFRYKESEYTSNKAVRELINSLEKSGIKTEVTKYTYDDLFKQQMIIYEEVKNYYGDESKLPKFELVSDIYEGKVKFSAESLDNNLLEKLMENHSNVLEFKLEKFNSTGVSEKSVMSNWNKLGAGLGILPPGGSCSVAGIAYKNGQYFF
ncbi:hypothetical protein FQ087_08425 [Sporosarcina sp. ANT_H38]|uniref:hypothetical protein n=1 Tax=Sporosarcina sp. ANT_H38 TaxID=2597358 RepID=UPI0011F24111|nr:hypothetical protein [Sporosarcina sp. ANT_H38]KAA0966250.1 hypothetical protein FQ087_08425 [Sporosarcina sp. ANT_H38]